MNGKIDSWGNLCIERAGQMKVMECRIGGNVPGGYYDHFEACNHNCPLFGEPVTVEKIAGYEKPDFPNLPKPQVEPRIVVDLCHGRELQFSTFTDERGTK